MDQKLIHTEHELFGNNISRLSHNCPSYWQVEHKLKLPQGAWCRSNYQLCSKCSLHSKIHIRVEGFSFQHSSDDKLEVPDNSYVSEIHRSAEFAWNDIYNSCYTYPDDSPEICTAESQASKLHYPLQDSLPESWNDHVIPLIISKFSFDIARGFNKSIFNTIPRVIAEVEDGSVLFTACNAVGCAYMANITRSPNVIFYRAKAYTTALAALNSALLDPQEHTNDKVLLSVWLLSLYELMLGNTDHTGPSGWHIHSQGMLELLRQRDIEWLAQRDGRNIFWIILNTVLFQALSAGRECPRDSFTWIGEIYKRSEPSEYPIIRAAIFSCHCVDICHRIHRLINGGDVDVLPSSISSILLDMDSVESNAKPLSNKRPIRYCVIEPPLAPYTLPTNIDLRYVGTIVYSSHFRMQLSYKTLVLLNSASKSSSCTQIQEMFFEQLRHRCIQEFQALAEKVLTVLTVMPGIDLMAITNQSEQSNKEAPRYRLLGWSDTIRLLQPLRLIEGCPLSLDWQRSAAKNILNLINRHLGIM